MTRKQKRVLTGSAIIVLAGAIVAVVIYNLPQRTPGVPDGQTTQPQPQAQVPPQAPPAPRAGHIDVLPDGTPPVPTQPAATQVPAPNAAITSQRAKELFDEGMRLSKDNSRLIDARTELSQAVFSELLSPVDAAAARATLWELARKTIFSPTLYPDDPYGELYTMKSGDRLADRTVNGKTMQGLVMSRDLRVPASAIEMALGTTADKLQAGKAYKLLKGPFHVIVRKHEFVMDVYLQHDGAPKTFVRRISVGLGKNGSTPVGCWVVELKDGGKGKKATWYPPPSSGLTGPIYPDDPRYAFGTKGLWIGLKGIDDATRGHDGYGIHSTNDQTSMGKESSLGCVRLTDDDIEFVFSLLFENRSTVWIMP